VTRPARTGAGTLPLHDALPICAVALPFSRDPDSGEAIVFYAEPDLLRFVAPMPGYLSRGGPYLMEFELVRGPRGQQLLFRHFLLDRKSTRLNSSHVKSSYAVFC